MKETEEKEGGEDQFNEVGERRGAGELFLFSVLRCREGQRQKEEKRRDGSIQYTKDEYMKAHPITFTLSHPLLPPPSLPPFAAVLSRTTFGGRLDAAVCCHAAFHGSISAPAALCEAEDEFT